METARILKAPAGIANGLKLYISALVCALILISILGRQPLRIGALELSLSVQPALNGQTVVEIPPLAAIRANTHLTPVKITVRLESIELQSVWKMFDKNRNGGDLALEVTGGLRTAVALFALKLIALAAIGGAFGVFLWQRQPSVCHLRGALVASVTVGLLLAGTYASYDSNRFKNPEYEGALKAAPWVIGLASQTLGKIDTLNNKMGMVAENVNQLFNQIDQLQPFDESPEGLVKVLHVSDIHNNPAALGYIQRIAELFEVDLIIDTGDITDYGTPLESLLLERLAGLKVPYLFIPGNHDSPETVKKLKSIPGVTVFDGNALTVKKLRIMGVPDPSSATDDIEPPPLQLIPQYAGQIAKLLSEQPERPDILALHNNRIAGKLSGEAPVIMYGHDHRLSVEEENGSVMIDAGSAGAAGLRRLQGDHTPYSLVIQYYAPAPDTGRMKILAADAITVKNLGSGFHVERFVFGSDQKTSGATP